MTRHQFAETVAEHCARPFLRARVTTLQVNVGLRCDLACHHCHVEAGPKRTETMAPRTADRVLALLAGNPGIATLDLTGGAPELQEEFRKLVTGAHALGRRVIDRCNLTVFDAPGQHDTPEFLARHGVRVVASLPCYTRENVEQQRGRFVFDRSIAALQRLNALGYGQAGARPAGGSAAHGLDLVYNPLGPSLPPPQAELEERYRSELRELFGIEFDRLLTITNMPIKRFAHQLAREGRAVEYQSLLVNHFNPETVPELMCRHLVSVSWDGRLFDCDFNQMLEIPAAAGPATLWEVDDFDTFAGEAIATGSHCFGCTAGSGSSCSGALQ